MQLEHGFDLVYLSTVKGEKMMDFRCRNEKEKVELSIMGIQTSVASHLPFILQEHTRVFHNKKRQRVMLGAGDGEDFFRQYR